MCVNKLRFEKGQDGEREEERDLLIEFNSPMKGNATETRTQQQEEREREDEDKG